MYQKVCERKVIGHVISTSTSTVTHPHTSRHSRLDGLLELLGLGLLEGDPGDGLGSLYHGFLGDLHSGNLGEERRKGEGRGRGKKKRRGKRERKEEKEREEGREEELS